MNKFFILIILVISSIASEDMKNFTTNRVYKNISKNAIFDSAKTLFNISNENNGNKDFILDSYIDKLEITKINFKYNVINTDIILDTWILELNQFENETRAILTFIRKDALNGENIKELNNNVHNLFWDRVDYILGLNKDWKSCSSYFSFNFFNSFCNNYFVNSKPEDSYILNNISISKENIKLNTVDNIKTNIFDKADLSSKYNNGIFNQSENIEEANFTIPILTENILEIKEQKKVKTIKLEEEPNQDYFNDENINNRVSNSLSNDKDITKFKEGLENIINKNSEINYTNSIKTLFENTDYKENSEVDLKLKENNNEN